MTFHVQKKLKYIQLLQETYFPPSFKCLVIFHYVYFSISLPIFVSLVLSNL